MGIAVVTGASSGIGKAIYDHFNTSDRFDSVVGIAKNGPDLEYDLSSEKDIQEIVDDLRTAGDISCLVNCAGILKLEEVGNEGQIFDVNFWAPYYLTNALKHELIAARGCVINIASVSGMIAEPEIPIYAASKAALISLTKSLAIRFSPFFVRVNCISPGFVKTNLIPGDTPVELLNAIPLGFEAEPAMLLPVVDMILDCPYVTGANFVVDGGGSCRAAM
jgi:3-oxoacyl-[acyl-carrier protein] reductase